MATYQTCIDLIKDMESCVLKAYADQGGIWTIGWGHTGPEVEDGLVWDQAYADTELALDIELLAERLRTRLTVVLGNNQFSALLSLGYNIGIAALGRSSALRLANAGNLDAVPAAIRLWNKSKIDGVLQVNRGLTARRAAECALWSLPDMHV